MFSGFHYESVHMCPQDDRQYADEWEAATNGMLSRETPTELRAVAEDKREPGKREKAEETISYSASPGLAARLRKLKASFGFISYQSNLLYLIGQNGQGGINIHQSVIAKPMGICPDGPGGLVLTGGYQVLRFRNVLEPDQRANDLFDACYVPRTIHVTGRLDAHDVGVDDQGRVIFVNTRYNCLGHDIRPA